MRRDGKKICSLLAVLAFGFLLSAGAAQPEREIAGVGDKAQNAKTEENRDAVSDADQGNRLLDSFQIEVDRNRFQIACVGDSITAGAGVEETGELPYPDILQELAGEKVQVHNFGVKGRSLLSTSRWPYREEGYYQMSLAVSADLYILMLGSNDIWQESWDGETFQRELVDFVASYQNLESRSVIYLVQPPAYFPAADDAEGQEKNGYMPELCQRVAAAAEETGAGLIDLYTYTRGHPEWFADEVHPNGEGNRQIAAFIYRCTRDDLP